jgi:hypothetical protein
VRANYLQPAKTGTVTASSNIYIDLGVLPSNGFSIGWANLWSTGSARWELRYNNAGSAVGDDANTSVWPSVSEHGSVVTAANNPIEIPMNQVTAFWQASGVGGDGTQHVWLKVTDLSGSSNPVIFNYTAGRGNTVLPPTPIS